MTYLRMPPKRGILQTKKMSTSVKRGLQIHESNFYVFQSMA